MFKIWDHTCEHTHLHRHTKQEGDEVHDGETGQQLALQDHVLMVGLPLLHGAVVVVRGADLLVHHDHVDHHAHDGHAEHQAHKERPPPPETTRNEEFIQTLNVE